MTGNRWVSLPFSDHCEPLAENPESFKEVCTTLSRSASDQLRYIELCPKTSAWMCPPGYARARTFAHHELTLAGRIDDTFSRIHNNSVRRKLRRTGREGLMCRLGTSEASVNEFYRLVILTRRRHGIPPQPRQWLRNLIAHLGTAVQLRLAFEGERAIAGILTLEHRATVTFKYGCSDAAVHNLGAVPFLMWNVIEDATAKGFDTLDLGRSGIENHGLIAFKEHLGATRSDLTYWRSPAPRAEDERRRPHATKWLIQHLPDAALTAAGRLFYRHFA